MAILHHAKTLVNRPAAEPLRRPRDLPYKSGMVVPIQFVSALAPVAIRRNLFGD
jgi:hypothetical protein